MTLPVNDDDYADDVDAPDALPPETDPATIPPDQGDKGSA